ncbi:MAG: cell division protein FtsZ [Pyrinomonadaceae bacterium]|nr:cell division protein FtsZ [Pyrinomonadaceae bacterium]
MKNSNSVRFQLDEPQFTGARIKVIGVGGSGGNAINHMIDAKVKGVEFVAINTDIQDLKKSKAPLKIQIGEKLTRGLGAGANPEIGREAAIEDAEKIMEVLKDTDMVFITAGLGGGTGTGAAPVIASFAVEMGVLTVAVVTKPFAVEGKKKMQQAEQGVNELKGVVDTLLVIPNSKLKELEENISIKQAFQRANDLLLQAVQGISDLITETGVINLDFADVRTVMKGMGLALMGVGTARGEKGAVKAMKAALDSRLLEESSIRGAKGVLINFTCGDDIPLNDVEEALGLVQAEADEQANIIFGLINLPSLEDQVKVTLIATGFDQIVQQDLQPKQEEKLRHYDFRKNYLISEMPDKKELDIPTFIRRQAD